MNTQVAALASVQEKVQERIRQQLADLIPEEMWAGLVQSECKKFLEEEVPKLIKEHLKTELGAQIQATLRKPEWQEKFSYNSEFLSARNSEMMTSVIKECAPELVSALFAGIGANLVMHIRNGSMGRF